jgi:hypothetical protein
MKFKEITVGEKEMNEDEIFEERQFRVFVFGLPRSGTSMMTRVCDLLGVKMVYTSEEKKKIRDAKYKKLFGAYHPNPEGFYEITDNPAENYLKILSEPYTGCKLIIPVNGLQLSLLTLVPSRVIFMKRPIDEIRESQEAFYNADPPSKEAIRTLWAQQTIRLRRMQIPFVNVNYRDVVNNPEKEIYRVAAFINAPEPMDAAISSIDPMLTRFKVEELRKAEIAKQREKELKEAEDGEVKDGNGD